MTGRYPDWEYRLSRLYHERRTMPFEWGRQDCATFAADALLAMTGEDYLGNLRGRWKTAIGAKRILNRYGGIVAAVRATVDLRENKDRYVKRGDLCAVPQDGGTVLGISGGLQVLAPGREGIATMPLSSIITSWEIG